MNQNRMIAVKARKPGISRTDCRTPMSWPLKEAASLAKLLISALQLAKPNQSTKASAIRNSAGDASAALPRRTAGTGSVIAGVR